ETESEVETSPQVRPSPQNDSTQQPVVQVRNSAKSGCNLLIPRLRLRSIRLTPRAAMLADLPDPAYNCKNTKGYAPRLGEVISANVHLGCAIVVVSSIRSSLNR